MAEINFKGIKNIWRKNYKPKVVKPEEKNNANNPPSNAVNVKVLGDKVTKEIKFPPEEQFANDEGESPKERRFKPLKKSSLTIFLIENTSCINDYKKYFNKIFEKVKDDSFVCIIRYDAVVKVSEVKKKFDFDEKELVIESDSLDEKLCFYDALKNLCDIVNEYLNKTIEDNINRNQIESIEVIGIGNCNDKSSSIGYDEVSVMFDNILDKKIVTKYYFTKKEFMSLGSQLGFRTIIYLGIDW